MTKPLPFTQEGVKRAILAIEKAGKFAVGIRLDGASTTVIIGDKPVDTASLVPMELHNASTSEWED